MDRRPLLVNDIEEASSQSSSHTYRSTVNNEQTLPRKTVKYRLRLAVVIIGCTICSLVIGAIFITSYVIAPVENACRTWSSSITVVGGSLMLVSSMSSGLIVVPHLSIHSNTMWLVASFVACGVGFGLCGVAVAYCDWSSAFTQFAYLVGFLCIGFGRFLPNPIVSLSLLSWLPERRGISSCYSAVFASVGALVLSQFLIFGQSLIKRGVIDAAVLIFATGILVVLMILVGILTIVPPPPADNDLANGNSDSTSTTKTKMTRVEILQTRQFAVISIARFIGPFCEFGLTARQQDFLNTIWRTDNPPIAMLGALTFGSFIGGRLFWLVMAEKFNNRWCWSVSLGVQAVAIGFLPWLVYYNHNSWSKYAALVDFFVINITFPGTKITSFGTCLEVFGLQSCSTAYGMSHIPYGISGITAPLLFELCLKRLKEYTPILYASAGGSLIGLIACLWALHL